MTNFEILHHSYRVKCSSGEKLSDILEEEILPWKYYVYNLVFRASGELKEMCMNDTKKWKEGRVCIDTKKYDEYLNGIEFNWNHKDEIDVEGKSYIPVTTINTSGIDKNSLFVNGYLENISPFLIYHEKFDVFQFREYLQHHPATTGIIQMIEELKNGNSYGIQASYCQFYSCLRSLENFWD